MQCPLSTHCGPSESPPTVRRKIAGAAMRIQDIRIRSRWNACKSLWSSAQVFSSRGSRMRAVLGATIMLALAPPVVARAETAAQTAAMPALRIEHLRPGVAVLFGPGPTGGSNITVGYGPGKLVIVDDQVVHFGTRVVEAVKSL